jgi:hypothetical protein
MSNSSSYTNLQAPYATTIYPVDPVNILYYVVSGSNEIVGCVEVDVDTFEPTYKSSDILDLSGTTLVGNKYLAGVLDDTDQEGPSRVIAVSTDGVDTTIHQMQYDFGSIFGTPYVIPGGLDGNYINRIDYYPFANSAPVSKAMLLVSHNQVGTFTGLIAFELDGGHNIQNSYNIPYQEPSNPVLPPYWGADSDYRGDYYAAIPAADPNISQGRIHAIYKGADLRLTAANIELQGFGAAYSSSYTTVAKLGINEHTTTGVVDIEGSAGFAYFTLQGQNNIYASSFDISLINYLATGTPIARLLCDRDMVRYDTAYSMITQQANSNNTINNIIAVLEDGTILTNIKAGQFDAQFSYEVVDARQYVGAGSKITNATINKNVDLVSSGSASLLHVWVESTTKGKSSMFVVNLDTNEIQDPIHVGFLSNASQPLFGSQQSGSSMFTADNRTTSVLGLTQNLYEINPTTGVQSRYLYKFDVQ